jgi:hypothetical protein
MTDLNPVDAMTTPPEKLFAKWEDDILNERENVDVVLDCAWKNGFVAGADQELEACCKWLPKLPPWSGNDLRKHRRPNPPSLKDQALEALKALPTPAGQVTADRLDTIRRALAALPE